MVEIALFQPDIPPNAGTILRMGTCLGVTVRIIEPAGFVWSDRNLRRAGLDYLREASVVRHDSWTAFLEAVADRRIVLLSTRASERHLDFTFGRGDVLLFGRETSGVPDHVHAAAAARLRIPMRQGLRSLNVAVACAIVTAEALRQTDGWP